MDFDELRFTEIDGFWWILFDSDRFWWILMEFDRICWNLIEFDRIWSNLLEFDQALDFDGPRVIEIDGFW